MKKNFDANALTYFISFEKFRKTYRKAPVMEPLSIKIVGGTPTLRPTMWC